MRHQKLKLNTNICWKNLVTRKLKRRWHVIKILHNEFHYCNSLLFIFMLIIARYSTKNLHFDSQKKLSHLIILKLRVQDIKEK